MVFNRNAQELQQKFWYHQVFLAGCTGGIVKAVVACPIELSKVRLQITVSKLKKKKKTSGDTDNIGRYTNNFCFKFLLTFH